MQRQRIGQVIGKGLQGIVFADTKDHSRVLKELRLVRARGGVQTSIRKETEATIEMMRLASDKRIGPRVYNVFYDTDGKKVYVEMDRVIPARPTDKDVDSIIRLYEKMFENHFVSFDSEFARDPSRKGAWILIDFGVAHRYPSYQDAVRAAVEEDLFADTGIGYYHPRLERHFHQRLVGISPPKK